MDWHWQEPATSRARRHAALHIWNAWPCMKIARVRQKQLQKAAPGFDGIRADSHWRRNNTHGEEGGLPFRWPSFLWSNDRFPCQLLAKKEKLFGLSKARPQNLGPRGTCRDFTCWDEVIPVTNRGAGTRAAWGEKLFLRAHQNLSTTWIWSF